MNCLYKYLAVGCVTAMTSLTSVAMAAPSPDGTEKTDAAATTQNSGKSLADIDVANYLIRNLYREPDKDVSDFDNWLRGWIISAYWNPNFAVHDGNLHKNDFSTDGFGFAVSKDMSPASTFRLDYSYRSSQGFNALVKRNRISFDYLFNITNFYYGYDRSRENEWLLSMGVQAGTSTNQQGSLADSLHSWVKPVNTLLGWGGVHLGLQYRKNLSNNLTFFVEQQFEINSDNWDGMNNEYDIDPSLNVLVGLAYRLGKSNLNIKSDDEEHQYEWQHNTFIQLYGGLSRIATNEALLFDGAGKYTGKTPGLNFGFSIGKYLNPSLGFRVGFFENVMGHNSKPDPAVGETMDYSNFMTYRGGRAELLFNPLQVFADRISIGRIGWDLSAGVEVGQLHLHHYGYNNYFPYHDNDPSVTFNNGGKPVVGLTLGTQLKYFVNNHTALFLEGRMSNLKYNYTENDGFTVGNTAMSGSNKETIYSSSVGIEYYIGGFDRYSRFSRWDTYETKPIERLSYDKRLYLEVAGGLGHQIHWGEHFPNTFDVEGTVGLGMHYNDYFGARTRFSYGYRNNKMAIGSAFTGNPYVGRVSSIYRLGVDATVSISNLLMGPDQTGERVGDLYFFAGPLVGGYNADIEAGKFGELTIGGEAGVQLVRRLTPEWEIFLEPRYEFYQKVLTNRWDLLVGVIYNYNADKNEEYKEEYSKWANRWFVETALGAGLDNKANALGASGRVGVGRRFNPYSSIRLNSMFTLIDPMDMGDYSLGNEKHSFKVGVGTDYMLNVTNLWYGVNPFRKTNLRFFAGPTFNLGGVTKSNENAQIHIGAESGLQWSYDLFDNFSLFVEPRAEIGLMDSPYGSRFDVLMGATWYNNYHSWRANRLFFNDDAHYPWALVEPGYVRPGQKSVDADVRNNNWFLEAALGATAPMGEFNQDLSKIKLLSPAVSLGLGYQFDNYQAIRLTGNFAKENNQMYKGDATSYNLWTSLDYRFNLTNLVMGINPYRPMDAYIFAGPQVRLIDFTKRVVPTKFALGAMGGAHLAYHWNDNLDIFAEARYSNYNIFDRLSSKLPDQENVGDRTHNSVMGFLGVTWYNKQFDHNLMLPYDTDMRYGNWFYQMALGGALPTQSRDKVFDLWGGGFAALGYQLDKLSSVRVNYTGMGLLKRSDIQKTAEGRKMLLSLGADYMFNATNFILGENPYRRFDIQLLAGPAVRVVDFNSEENPSSLVPGLSFGGQLLYHLNDYIDLFGEARYDYWTKGYTNRLDAFAGATYYTRPVDRTRVQPINTTPRNNNWFYQGALGIATPTEAKDRAADLWDGAFAALGYQFDKYSSVRVNGTGMFLLNQDKINKTVEGRKMFLSLGTDYMFNATNFILGENPYRRLDLQLLAGPALRLIDFNSSEKETQYIPGVSAGTQLLYHLNDHMDLFGEARYDYWLKDYSNRVDAFAGVTYYTLPLDRKRFNPYDESYRYGNWFYQGAAGLAIPTHTQNRVADVWGGSFVAMGYQFNKLHSVRANGTGMLLLNRSKIGKTAEGRKMYASLGLDYMFNTTNFFLGENPYRRFDVNLLAGPALRIIDFNSEENPTSFVLGASAGGQLLYHLNKQMDIFGEARYDYWGQDYPRRIDAFAGVTYYSKPAGVYTGSWTTDEKSHYKNWFIEAALGGSLPLDSKNVPGMSDKMGLGYVFGPYSTVRANMFNHWHLSRSMETKEKHKYVMAGDIEYMLNATNLMYGDAHRRVEFLPFVGISTRVENVTKADKNISWIMGAVGGLQANYHLTQGIDLFAQGQYEHWMDDVAEDRLSAYFGSRLYYNGMFAGHTTPGGKPTAQPTAKPTSKPVTRIDRDGNKVEVKPRPVDSENNQTWFVDLGVGIGGSVAPIYNNSSAGALGKMKYVDPTFHAGLGMHFNDHLSARARANVTYVGDKHANETMEDHSFIFETALDGMWNMTNTLLGINPYRKVDLYAFAGPTLLFENITEKDHKFFDSKKMKLHVGVNTGGRIAYHLNNNVDLVAEGRADWLDRSNHYYNRIEGMLGSSFRIDNRVRKSSKQLMTDRLYLQFLAGYQLASVEGTSLFKYSQNNFGKMPSLDYRVGYHLNEVWSVQASAFSQQVNYHDWPKGEGNHVAQYGGRAEAVLSVLNLFNTQFEAFDERLNWTMSAGVQSSRFITDYNDKKTDFGVTAATQAQYRLTDYTWALAELRTQTVNLKGVHMPITLSLGVQHDLRAASTTKKVGEPINGNHNHLQISAGMGAYNGKRGGFEGALLYRFATNSALRLKGEAFNNGYPQPDGTGKLGGYLAVGGDYMLNVTNLFLGVDDYRRTNLYAFGGATIVTRGFFQSLKNKEFSALTSCFDNGFGINYGLHADVKINRSLSAYGEARFVNLTKKTDLNEIYKDKFNLFTTLGLKYNLPW